MDGKPFVKIRDLQNGLTMLGIILCVSRSQMY